MLAFISLLWAGEVIGLSFLATVIKFQAVQYGATMPMLLAVGKVTFNLQNTVDIILSVVVIGVLIGRLWAGSVAMWVIMVYLGVLVIIIIQSFYLLPILDMRTEAHINGTPMPPSYDHIVYIVVEVLKVILLLIYPIKSIVFK